MRKYIFGQEPFLVETWMSRKRSTFPYPNIKKPRPQTTRFYSQIPTIFLPFNITFGVSGDLKGFWWFKHWDIWTRWVIKGISHRMKFLILIRSIPSRQLKDFRHVKRSGRKHFLSQFPLPRKCVFYSHILLMTRIHYEMLITLTTFVRDWANELPG